MVWRQRRALARAKAGDNEAFVELVRPELERLHQAAYYLARDADEARDLAQEALVRAFLAMGDFRAGAPLRPWLHRILRNLFLDRKKSAAVRHEVRADEDDRAAEEEGLASAVGGSSGASPLEALLVAERRSELTEHVRSLPEGFREVLILCDLQELGYTEVSEITGLPLGTVKSRLSRARLMLRERLAGGEPIAGQSRNRSRGAS